MEKTPLTYFREIIRNLEDSEAEKIVWETSIRACSENGIDLTLLEKKSEEWLKDTLEVCSCALLKQKGNDSYLEEYSLYIRIREDEYCIGIYLGKHHLSKKAYLMLSSKNEDGVYVSIDGRKEAIENQMTIRKMIECMQEYVEDLPQYRLYFATGEICFSNEYIPFYQMEG